MKKIAIIPARSGSKGVVHKNIKELNGKPLIAYTIQAAIDSQKFDKIIVSTDSKEYADISIKYGASVPFLRTNENSTDNASSWDVVREVLNSLEEKYDVVALLQPTSPLRTSEDIINGFSLMEEKNANAVIGVCVCDHSPLISNTLNEDLNMHDFIKKEVINSPRQKLSQYYRINGALYIVKSDIILQKKEIYNEHCFAYIMEKSHSVDIDDEIDFELARVLLNQKKEN